MKNKFIYYVGIRDLETPDREHVASLGVDISSLNDCYILPGFTDVHVHLREPGFLYKETVATGTGAAAAGGFTDIMSMPNLNPCPDSSDNLQVQIDAINKDAVVHVYPYGAITVGQGGENLADMQSLANDVIAFTDDGRGVASGEVMEEAMTTAKSMGKLIVAHCEDENYSKDAPEAEWKQLKRDLELVRKTGCSYHVCHISTKESVELVRIAKEEGLDVTCETAPHYLTITKEEIDECIQRQPAEGGRFKMNPPIKSAADRDALIEAVKDGTIDMIATDHAPHSPEEKDKGFDESAFGIVGLETAFPVMYTNLVKSGIISLPELIRLLYINPRKRFGLTVRSLEEELKNENMTFAIWDLNSEYEIDPEAFYTKGRSTPFAGWNVQGKCMMTVIDGKPVWKR